MLFRSRGLFANIGHLVDAISGGVGELLTLLASLTDGRFNISPNSVNYACVLAILFGLCIGLIVCHFNTFKNPCDGNLGAKRASYRACEQSISIAAPHHNPLTVGLFRVQYYFRFWQRKGAWTESCAGNSASWTV